MNGYSVRSRSPQFIDKLISPKVHRVVAALAVLSLGAGFGLWVVDAQTVAHQVWMAGTVPAVALLGLVILCSILEGRVGVDGVALIAMGAALVLGEPLAGLIVAIMYTGGTLLEAYATGRAERDLKRLEDRAPRVAHRVVDGQVETVPVGSVAVGDLLRVRAGEIVPVDGIVEGEALVDEAAVTGEPYAVSKTSGQGVRSGTVNAGEAFRFRATAISEESTYAGIVRMVRAAGEARAPFIRMADRYAVLFLPFTLIVAGGAWAISSDPVRALAVLVVATPCPLIIAAPVAFVAGISRAARRGILIKGGAVVEALADVQSAIFDKTGTLTLGGARVVAIETAPGVDPDTVLQLAASLEQASRHSLATTIVETARVRGLPLVHPDQVKESRGSGLEGVVGDVAVKAGSLSMVHAEEDLPQWAEVALRRARWRSALTVFVTVDGKLSGCLLLADELRTEAPGALSSLRALGIRPLTMLTGDDPDTAAMLASGLPLDAVQARCTPADKIEAVRQRQAAGSVAMIGDGINDAPALAAANVGIAMGARGANASTEAADVVLLVENLNRAPEAIAIARRTRRIASQSVIGGLGLSVMAMGFAALGHLPPVAGALIQEAIDVVVIANALRALSGAPGRLLRMESDDVSAVAHAHASISQALATLQALADRLETASGSDAAALIGEASAVVDRVILVHEREDDRVRYPALLSSPHHAALLTSLGYAHSEIMRIAGLLSMMTRDLGERAPDPSLARDAQRAIERLVVLVQLHNRQEDAIAGD